MFTAVGADPLADGDGEALGLALGVGLGDALLLAPALAEGDGDGLELPSGDGEADGVAGSETRTERSAVSDFVPRSALTCTFTVPVLSGVKVMLWPLLE